MTFWQVSDISVLISICVPNRQRVINPSSLSVSAEREQVALIVEVLDEFPELAILYEMLNIFVLDIVAHTRTPGEVQKGLMHKASTQEEIVTMQFSIGLFQKHHPELIAMALREEGLTIWIARDEIVNSDSYPLSVLAEAQLVDPSSV